MSQLEAYFNHLSATAEWLLASERPRGGSAAYRSPLVGWSRAYPETTGYAIPTLLALAVQLGEPRYAAAASRFGEWLLSIQNVEGSWNGGLHPAERPRPSVFNTGQILLGLMALHRRGGDERWLKAAERGAGWLFGNMAPGGLWLGKDYRADRTPSYYTHVLWPLADVGVELGRTEIIERVRLSYERVVERILGNGVVSGWAFKEGEPAFTHTIAYTIRGIQEGSRILEDEELESVAESAIEKLVRVAELRAGRLPGAFDEDWRPVEGFICLTGNAQLASSILTLEERRPDLRLVNAAARLVDVVCASQRFLGGRVSGAVAGSAPVWGRYLRFRYPNWAAKYHCDALMSLIQRLSREWNLNRG